MKVERFIVQACCGNTGIVFKIGQPITTGLLTKLVNKGFTEWVKFTESGILYVDNMDFILTGAFGLDKLQATCKFTKDCDQKLNELEGLLLQME
jgi:hypothetical protein